MRDYYEILDVPKDATQEEIRTAYHDLAKIYHPDRLKEMSERTRRTAEQIFKKINEAYEVLSDPVKRARYDQDFRGDKATPPRSTTKPQQPPPEIVIHPSAVDFGAVELGKRRTRSFTIENRGGRIEEYPEFGWEGQPPDWVRVETQADPDDVYPFKVTLTADTGKAPLGYGGFRLLVFVDDQVHAVEMTIEVIGVQPAVVPTPKKAAPAKPVARPVKTKKPAPSIVPALVITIAFVSVMLLLSPLIGKREEQRIAISAQNTQISAPVAVPTEVNIITRTLRPTATRTPVPTLRSTVPPRVVDISVPSVSIRIVDNLMQFPTAIAPTAGVPGGRLSVTVRAGRSPLKEVDFYICYAVKDIAGNWTLSGEVRKPDPYGDLIHCNTDVNGVCITSLQPGTYALVDFSFGAGWQKLRGAWGIYVPTHPWAGQPEDTFIPFVIEEGKTTEILVDLAILEIGVLSAEGDAVSGKIVEVLCQDTDIAGKKIEGDTCSSPYNYRKTDAGGLATFYLGAGTYMINVDNFPRKPHDVYFYDIVLKPGESRREVFSLP